MWDKTCGICRESLPLARFSRNGVRSDTGAQVYQWACKGCISARRKERYKPQSDETNLRRYFRTRYNISVEQYQERLAAQGGCCAVCGRSEADNGARLSVDHDHTCCPLKGQSCGKCIRGLLCNSCNTGMGHLGDDPDRLLSAAAYILQTRNVMEMI